MKSFRVLSMMRTHRRICRRVENDPNKASYTDLALTPSTEAELETLEIFSATQSAKDAVKKRRPRPVARISASAAE